MKKTISPQTRGSEYTDVTFVETKEEEDTTPDIVILYGREREEREKVRSNLFKEDVNREVNTR